VPDAENQGGNASQEEMRRTEVNKAPGEEERSATDRVSGTLLRGDEGCI
jgi:hypothetical protein